ncbi:hypothetical protein [Dictyobacter vulcani]|uniref:hypothetical protein n=1 Tax=Dictyobacter vulcani TaxID=2607529 RepID=UPI0012507BAD|nr:hypothetical protein [Dictyobacter vulcani]
MYSHCLQKGAGALIIVVLLMRVGYRHRHRIRRSLLTVLVGGNNGHRGVGLVAAGISKPFMMVY